MFSSLLAGVLAAAIPVVVILISQLWVQSFDDFAYGVLGLCYSTITGACFQVILKKTIGGLRPHFLAVCQPVIPPVGRGTGIGYQNVMWTADQICTGDVFKIKNGLESFPSGHANVNFAGLGYLAIYLFAHLRIRRISRRRASYWRMLFVIAPLLLATYMSATLVLGYHHHGYDVVVGALIGSVMAFFGYRMVFHGVWNPRWNTLPIVRNVQDSGGDESIEMSRQSRERLNGDTAYQGATPGPDDSPERMPV